MGWWWWLDHRASASGTGACSGGPGTSTGGSGARTRGPGTCPVGAERASGH